MKKKIVSVLVFVFFTILLFAGILRVNYVLRPKEYEGAQDLFMKWKPEHADIVFVGSSHQFCCISPDLLHDEYNIESFMLATCAQTMPMSYYAVEEAIKYKHPDTIVLEALCVSNDFSVVENMDHCFFTGMPMDIRIKAIKDFVPDNRKLYYLMPLGMFHSRWKELSEADYAGFPLSSRGTFTTEHCERNHEIKLEDVNDKLPPDENIMKYVDGIVELCNENNVKLIMYIAPFNALYPDEECVEDLARRQKIFNSFRDYVNERGLICYNLFDNIEELGLDDNTDWMDTQHLNRFGQEKFTRYMAEKGYLGY